MNISEEKKYVYQMMREITEERRRLTEMYFTLKERLESLDKLEQRGLEDLSIQGYLDYLKMKDQELSTQNIAREASNIANTITNSTDRINVIEERMKEQNEEKKEEVKLKEEPKFKKEIQEESNRRRRAKYANVDKVMDEIVRILKEAGKPMSLDEMYKELIDSSEHYVTKNNFRNNIIRRLMQKHKKVERVTKGYYQYRYSGGSIFESKEDKKELVNKAEVKEENQEKQVSNG